MTRFPVAIAAIVMLSFAGAAPGQAQQPSHDAASLPSFKAVSIASSTSGLIDVRFYPDRFAARTLSLSELIEQAYGLQPGAVVSGPDWVHIDRFTVTATTGEAVSRDRMKLMLQSLLADRFQLQLARETQTGTVYRLTPRKVRNLKPPAKPHEQPVVSTDARDNLTILRYDFRNATMGGLAFTLSQYLQAPVIDETKLTGSFDFRVNFTHHDAFGHSIDLESHVPTIFAALEKQLGLTLVADQGQVPVYVVRRASKPSAN